MSLTDPIYTTDMTDRQRAWFCAEYERARKDEVVGVLLAIFLGGFGIHHFYVRRNGLGILYLLLGWTGIPMILGWIEAFFMPSRVRQYNLTQAVYIASQIRGSSSASSAAAPRCPSCSGFIEPGAIFCPHCGATLAGSYPLSTQTVL
jgi:TM2 domain-containing membrane protein YozV